MIYNLNKLNRRSNHSSIINEVDRKNLVGKTKKQSPGRYSRRIGYKPLSFRSISFDSLFKKDEFVINVPVGDYICTIAFKGLMEQLKYVLSHQPKPNLTLQTVIKAITRAIDAEDILVDCTCLTGDTEIKLLDNSKITLEELYNSFNNNKEYWVYSVDENGDFKPGKISSVSLTKYVNSTYRITLDNDKVIQCTKDHLFMLRDGSYLEAEKLEVGQSLMPLYFSKINGYESVKLNSTGKYESVYKIVSNELLYNEITEAKVRSGEDIIAIHHSDFNKLNNYPSNLKPMGKVEHWRYHANFIKDRRLHDPEFNQKLIDASIRNAYIRNENPTSKMIEQRNAFVQDGRDYWRQNNNQERLNEHNSIKQKEYWNNLSTEERKLEGISRSNKRIKSIVSKVIKYLIENNLDINELNFNSNKPKNCPRFNKIVELGLIDRYNHKIKDIQILEHEEIPVYDISVDKYHNFLLSAGVIVHNCSDFKYRFAYWATKYGYKYGKPENRPAKITNPNDKIGSFCKHLTALLANKKWLVKVASVINEFIKAYPNEVQEFLGLKDDEFIINDPKAKSIINKKRNLKKTTVIDKDEPEELEPIDPDEDNEENDSEEFSNKDDSDEELEINDEDDNS